MFATLKKMLFAGISILGLVSISWIVCVLILERHQGKLWEEQQKNKESIGRFYITGVESAVDLTFVSDSSILPLFSETMLFEKPSLDSLLKISLLIAMKKTLVEPYNSKNEWHRRWLWINGRFGDLGLLSLNEQSFVSSLAKSLNRNINVKAYSDLFASFDDRPPIGDNSQFLIVNLGLRNIYQDSAIEENRLKIREYLEVLLANNSSLNTIVLSPAPYLGRPNGRTVFLGLGGATITKYLREFGFLFEATEGLYNAQTKDRSAELKIILKDEVDRISDKFTLNKRKIQLLPTLTRTEQSQEKFYAIDGIHLSRIGHERMTQILTDAISIDQKSRAH